ncbi:MAG TPA: aminotransferase class I/II-fold pyridoxal phosphate-dependent enzyme, partial [Firmicutes bacterium]|nr:aminotransferase class I/II-fold pyridoxal phosphate-dependent enzyme [Bacillota bacterium]
MMLSKRAWSITPSPTMSIDAIVKEMMHKGINVIGFAAGEPDFDTPPHIAEAGIKAIREGYTRYTAATGNYELKKAICAKFWDDCGLEYNPSQIVVSNGA